MSTRIKRFKRRKYLIKAPKQRCEFEKILRKFGFRDRSPIHDTKLIYVPVLRDIHLPNNVTLSGFYLFYPNKKSFLYNSYLTYSKFMKNRRLVKSIKILLNEIYYEEKARICEVGWKVELGLNIIHLNSRQKATIYIKVLKFAKKILKSGNEFYQPKENDMLVSTPNGPKGLQRLNKRGKLNERIGFGKIKESRNQYGKYNNKLDLIPI